MRLEHYSQEKLKKEILEIVGKHLDLKQYKVFFFGSRVAGGGNEQSDIDVGIEGPHKVPFEILMNIKEEVENMPVLYKIDIVDFKNADKDFLEVAKQHREFLNR